jgi:uncharacterized membrane protein YfcA
MAWLLSIVSGLLAGTLSGIFGIGGGVVLVPLLGLLLGLPQHDAQGVTLATLVLPLGAAALVEYQRAGAVRWRLVGPLIAGFVCGVGLGSLAANAVPDRPLRLVFALFVVAMAAQTARGARVGEAKGRASAPHAGWHAVWIGSVGGIASGLLGIGGGVVMIPLLVSVTGLDQYEAQGTSLATMLPPVGLPGVLVYAHARGGLPWRVMGFVALGFFAGGALGALVASRLRGPRLSRAFAAFLACVAAALLWRALRPC